MQNRFVLCMTDCISNTSNGYLNTRINHREQDFSLYYPSTIIPEMLRTFMEGPGIFDTVSALHHWLKTTLFPRSAPHNGSIMDKFKNVRPREEMEPWVRLKNSTFSDVAKSQAIFALEMHTMRSKIGRRCSLRPEA